MGNIQTTYNRSKDLTTFKVTGRMKVADFYDCLASYYGGRVTRLALWDLTEADLAGIDTDEISDLAEYARHLAKVRQGGKTAMVFGRPFEFGLGRMFETYLEIAGVPLEISIYRRLEEAKAWLNSGGDDDCRD